MITAQNAFFTRFASRLIDLPTIRLLSTILIDVVYQIVTFISVLCNRAETPLSAQLEIFRLFQIKCN